VVEEEGAGAAAVANFAQIEQNMDEGVGVGRGAVGAVGSGEKAQRQRKSVGFAGPNAKIESRFDEGVPASIAVGGLPTGRSAGAPSIESPKPPSEPPANPFLGLPEFEDPKARARQFRRYTRNKLKGGDGG
jgi:hypothetical protein